MEELYPYKKVKILNATIIVYLMHLQQSLMYQCLFTVLKHKLLKIYFSLLSQLNQIVFLFCHSLSELNGPIQNGTKSHLVLLLKIETIYNQDIIKLTQDLYQAAKLESLSMSFYLSEPHSQEEFKSSTVFSSTVSKSQQFLRTKVVIVLHSSSK